MHGTRLSESTQGVEKHGHEGCESGDRLAAELAVCAEHCVEHGSQSNDGYHGERGDDRGTHAVDTSGCRGERREPHLEHAAHEETQQRVRARDAEGGDDRGRVLDELCDDRRRARQQVFAHTEHAHGKLPRTNNHEPHSDRRDNPHDTLGASALGACALGASALGACRQSCRIH